MIEWIGSLLLAFCGVPELIRTLRTKKSSIGWGMLLTWFFGEVLVLIHVLSIKEYALLTNYSINIAILIVLIYYKKRYK